MPMASAGAVAETIRSLTAVARNERRGGRPGRRSHGAGFSRRSRCAEATDSLAIIIATSRQDLDDFRCFRWALSLQSRLGWRHKHLQCQGEVGQHVRSVWEQVGAYSDKADAAGKD
jgi:hypothetical protein